MRTLSRKLTLAFLLVGLVSIGLAAAFVWVYTSAEFDRYILDQRQSEFVAVVTAYYQENGSWPGVDVALRERGLLPPLTAPGGGAPDPQPFALADQNRVIIVPGGTFTRGMKVQKGALDKGVAIEVDGVVVGTVLLSGQAPARNTIEEKYIAGVNQSLLIAALGGTGIALLLGIWMARTLSRPARELTAAAHAMSRGELEQRVPVRSKDELGELAESFNQMSASLARANRQRRQMTADIAHELRNPLTVIGGYVESMRDGVLPATPERFDAIDAEVRHLQRLVEELRTLSLADAGELTIRPQPVTAADLLERQASAYQAAARQKDITLIVDLEPGLPALNADPDRLAQVLGNLASNALQHTPSGGRVVLFARREDHSVALGVRDTGAGISPEALPHIFDRFYREDPSRQEGGSGLGLAIVKAIVELHGGQVRAASDGKGKGCEIAALLPVT